MRILFLFLITVVFVAALPARSAPERTIAGSASCIECHEDIHRAWTKTGHARTFLPAAEDTLPRVAVEGGTAIHAPGRSVFSKGEDGFGVETLGPDGKRSVFPLTDVVGVRRIRMFLTRLPDGRRQVLPGMLDAPRDEWFDYTHLIFGVPGTDPKTAPKIAPGEPTFWAGMPRFFDARCARCHTTDHRFTIPDEETGGDWSTFKERGVGCESCHGGGAEHARYQSGDGEGDDPILTMGDLDRERAVSVCLRCHMEADVVKPGFRPGDDFFDHFDPTLLDDVERVDPAGRPLELIYDGTPFMVSRCGIEGEMTCTTCHDPHGGPYRSQLKTPPTDPALCSDCHEDVVAAGRQHTKHDPDRVGASCVGCHMPFLTIERGHGIVTDHTIGVPDPRRTGDRVAQDACTWCHTADRGAPGGVPALDRATIVDAYGRWWPEAKTRPGWAAPIRAAREGDPAAYDPLVRIAADGKAPRLVRASAAKLMGRFPHRAQKDLFRLFRSEDDMVRRAVADALGGIVTPEADSVLLKALNDESPAVRSRAARAALRGWERVRKNRRLLEAVIDVLGEETTAIPEDDLRWFLLGAAKQIAGDDEGAIRAYEMKLRLDPYATLVRKTVAALKRSK